MTDFTPAERAALYRAIALRRDVRAEFLPEAVDAGMLERVLAAAHQAPSVGLSQPWRFIVVREFAIRRAVHECFLRANAEATASYDAATAARYGALRLAGILDAPVNVCITCDDEPARGNGLGRRTMPETARYSTVCAIQNLWLAARVEGLGVGWSASSNPRSFAHYSASRIVSPSSRTSASDTLQRSRPSPISNATVGKHASRSQTSWTTSGTKAARSL